MTAGGIITALIIGLIIGALGRLVVPGRQNIPIWLTMLVGVGAALLGSVDRPGRRLRETATAGSTGASSCSRSRWPLSVWPWWPASRTAAAASVGTDHSATTRGARLRSRAPSGILGHDPDLPPVVKDFYVLSSRAEDKCQLA